MDTLVKLWSGLITLVDHLSQGPTFAVLQADLHGVHEAQLHTQGHEGGQ